MPQLFQINSDVSTPGRNDVSNDGYGARFEVPAAVLLKIQGFWGVPCHRGSVSEFRNKVVLKSCVQELL